MAAGADKQRTSTEAEIEEAQKRQFSPKIWEDLRTNERIKMVDGLFAYRPTHDNISSVDDLLNFLKGRQRDGGVKMGELADSWHGVQEAVQELVDKDLIWKVSDGKSSVLFYNDPHLRVEVDDSTRRL